MKMNAQELPLSHRIKNLRKGRGWKQTDLAEIKKLGDKDKEMIKHMINSLITKKS